MATTIYFEKDIPTTDDHAEAVHDQMALAEIYVSDFSGEDNLYIHLTDANKNKISMLLDKETALSFKQGLDNALADLKY